MAGEKEFAASSSLVGSYKLVTFTQKVIESGEVSYGIFGKHPGGYINYAPDGRMLVLMVADKNERPALASSALPTDEQAAGLFRTMLAYAGAYEFDGRTVSHNIDVSWYEGWVGTTQVREVQKDGDKLIYTTPPYPSAEDGRMSVATIVWQKVD